MSDKREALQAADEAYAELRQAVIGLDEQQMREPWLGTWGVREILVHSSGWHREMAPALRRIGRGERPYPDGTYDDADAWNARFVEARREAKTAAILDELGRHTESSLQWRRPFPTSSSRRACQPASSSKVRPAIITASTPPRSAPGGRRRWSRTKTAGRI